MEDMAIKQWSKWRNCVSADSDLIKELQQMEGNHTEINRLFCCDLEFGTGGLRGILGAGNSRMNVYTVAKATQAYSNYINKHYSQPSVAIAYDSRIKSDLFAKRSAEVFAANGIKVYLYRELMPTPCLSFAVRHLHCSGGIVITASHNPAEYNGYKVYGCDGCQITTLAADEISHEMRQIDLFMDIKKSLFQDGLDDGRIFYIDDETISAYISAVSLSSFCEPDCHQQTPIVYTPLNGSGRYCVTRALQENGFTNIAVVKEQEEPDGNFPTCPYPNPEVKETLTLGIKLAAKLGSGLVLATDPDCDRIGAAVRSGDNYVLLSGNEMGLLLLDYICKKRIANGTMPDRPVLVKTIVTTDMAKKIAAGYGVEVIDVLTGFKFIGEQIGLLEMQEETSRYLFGFEESYGYLSGSYVRDKDAVNGALLICGMYTYYKNLGRNLPEVLNELYDKYGYYLNTLRCYKLEKDEDINKLKSVMEQYRCLMPMTFAGKKVTAIRDYLRSVITYGDGRKEEIRLPKSDVLKFELEDNISVTIRPSGTEPKLKIYYSISAETEDKAGKSEENIARIIEQSLGVKSATELVHPAGFLTLGVKSPTEIV